MEPITVELKDDGEQTGVVRLRIGFGTQRTSWTQEHIIGSNEHPPQASLLGLPGECRNRIYREVLVDDCVINFYSDTSDGNSTPDRTFEESNAVEPALLRCCSLIRAEARPIFLQENEFRTTLQNNKMEPQFGHWFWLHLKPGNRRIDRTGEMSWQNTLEWLKAYRDGDLPADWDEIFELSRFDDEDQTIATTAYEIVEQLKGVRWDNVKVVLNHLFEAVNFAGSMSRPRYYIAA